MRLRLATFDPENPRGREGGIGLAVPVIEPDRRAVRAAARPMALEGLRSMLRG